MEFLDSGTPRKKLIERRIEMIPRDYFQPLSHPSADHCPFENFNLTINQKVRRWKSKLLRL